MANAGKQNEVAVGDAVVGVAARKSLHARLSAVESLLDRAADYADQDVEHVHRLRVASRRASAALKVYAGVLPRRKSAWFRRNVRRVCRAAGAARDLDVMSLMTRKSMDSADETSTAREDQNLAADLRKRRAAAQKPLLKIRAKLNQNRVFRRRIQRMLRKLRGTAAWKSPGLWSVRRLNRTVRRFFAASPADLHSLPDLHRFRIRCKELRYTMDVLTSAIPPDRWDELYSAIEECQDRIGRIHDHAVAGHRFREWRRETRHRSRRRHLKRLRQQQQTQLAETLEDFIRWWTPEFRATLQAGFQEALQQQAAAYRAAGSTDQV